MCTLIDPPATTHLSSLYLQTFISPCDHLWKSFLTCENPFLSMRMAFFMRNHLKSFSSMRISSSVRIFLNLFFCENFLKSSLSGRISSFYENILIFFICENLFLFLENFFCSLFLSLYENKPIYECHLLNL